LASITLAFALQPRKKHGKTSVRVAASKNKVAASKNKVAASKNDFSYAVFVRFIWHMALLSDSCYEDVGGI